MCELQAKAADYFFHCSNNILLQKLCLPMLFWTKFFTLYSIKSRSSFKFIIRIDWIKDSPLFLFWWLPRLCNPGYANKFRCCRHSIVIVSPMTNWFSIMPATSANVQWSKIGKKLFSSSQAWISRSKPTHYCVDVTSANIWFTAAG